MTVGGFVRARLDEMALVAIHVERCAAITFTCGPAGTPVARGVCDCIGPELARTLIRSDREIVEQYEGWLAVAQFTHNPTRYADAEAAITHLLAAVVLLAQRWSYHEDFDESWRA